MPDDLKHHEGISWRKGFYHWTGVTNPTRSWWEFWKPRKANIRLTFYYAHIDGELHVNRVYLNVAYA